MAINYVYSICHLGGQNSHLGVCVCKRSEVGLLAGDSLCNVRPINVPVMACDSLDHVDSEG